MTQPSLADRLRMSSYRFLEWRPDGSESKARFEKHTQSNRVVMVGKRLTTKRLLHEVLLQIVLQVSKGPHRRFACPKFSFNT